jgi:H+/Cl- antiporter ClcA
MKWMIVLGLIAGAVGGVYRWFLAPSDPEKWKLVDVLLAIMAIGGVAFFALGLLLLGLKQVFS